MIKGCEFSYDAAVAQDVGAGRDEIPDNLI